MREQILALVTLASTTLSVVSSAVGPLVSPVPEVQVLAEHTLDLGTRNKNPFVNEVFADNILLALHYFKGDADGFKLDPEKSGPGNINWEKVREPFESVLVLQAGEIFAFHGFLLREYQGLNVKTGKTKYTHSEGYKTVGGLPGNGVCHLASLINWTASGASLALDGESRRTGLEVVSKVNHNFLPVPGVPREFGTSIRYSPNGARNSQNQNLYIRNNLGIPITFVFRANSSSVTLMIVQ
ncbi:MAG: hypothetical protein ACOZBZ_04905 [Patescibacteria group bacterium]